MHGLYAIVDTQFLAKRGLDPISFARAVLEARPAALQLRAKDLAARETLRMLRALAPMCRAARVKLIANDRADLAALAGCDAVHIGQEDLPYALVHRIAPQLGIGISTHDLAQLDRALALKPLYVAFGPVYATESKANPDPVVGLDGLAAAVARARAAGVPLVAIGGINLARAADVAAHADAWAVIADLFPEGASLSEITLRARALDSAAGPPVSGESGPGPAGGLREAQ
jgi:thiamine-phosphate pyrophosphorylase